MKTNTMTLSKGAQNYITSLVEQGKIFTVSTVKTWFPDESDTEIMNFANEAVKGQKYSVITNSSVWVPSTMFANNAAMSGTVKIAARMSTVSSTRRMNVPLSSSVISQFKLSARPYRYSIEGKTITIHRSSKSTKMDTFTVWNNGKAVIPVPTMGDYTVVIK